MKFVDVSDNWRINTLLQMVRHISTAISPVQVYAAFASYYWQLRPLDYMISLSTKGLPEGQYRITREFDTAHIRQGVSTPSAMVKMPRKEDLPVHSGGFLGEVIAEGRPRIIHELYLKDDPVLKDRLANIGSACIMPLFDEGEPRYWTMQFRIEPNAFTVEELESGLLVGNLTGGNNTRLILVEEIRKLNAALKEQFEDVARVQRSLLPSKTPDIPGLDIATSYLTSDQAGGDYFDFFPFDDGSWGILIADVSGHGAAAATVMAMLHGILHAYAGPGRHPDAVLRWANKRLLHANIEGTFVTAFLSVYDPATGRLQYARSGHNPPMLKDGATGRVHMLDQGGSPPLGVFDPYEISSQSVQLKPGDTLVLYTDGITEAFNAAREMFGVNRLTGSLVECSGQPDCVVDSVHGALFEHTGHLRRADDQTLVAIQYKGRT